MIEKIRVWWWVFFRTICTVRKRAKIQNRDFWCFLGFHKMHRSKEWVGAKRLDECTKCGFSIWYIDRPGMQLKDYEKKLK